MTVSMQLPSNLLKPIRTNEEYESALARIYELIQENAEPETTLGDELEVLTLLVENYEQKMFPMPKPNPVDAIKFRMEQLGLPESEIVHIIGSRSRKSEIFAGKRKLSLAIIRRIHKALNISADVLIQDYSLSSAKKAKHPRTSKSQTTDLARDKKSAPQKSEH